MAHILERKYFVFYIENLEVGTIPFEGVSRGEVMEMIATIAKDRGVSNERIRVAVEWRPLPDALDTTGFDRVFSSMEEFFAKEYGGDVDICGELSDLRKVPIAYSTTDDGEHEVQIYADPLGLQLISTVDGDVVEEDKYPCLDALADDLDLFDFDVAISDAIDAWEKKQAQKNRYRKMKERQQKEFDALPLRFAFGEKQFDQMMVEWGLDPRKDMDKVCSLGAGCYIQLRDIPQFCQVSARHRAELRDAIAGDETGEGFIYEMFLASLTDHEYGYTWDSDDTLAELGFSPEDIASDERLNAGFRKAQKKITGV